MADLAAGGSRIAVLDLETGTHRVLFPGAMAQYAAGHLLYYRAGQYHMASFDPSTLAITADSQALLDGRMVVQEWLPDGRHRFFSRALTANSERPWQQLAPVDTVGCNVRWSAGVKELVFMRGASLA